MKERNCLNFTRLDNLRGHIETGHEGKKPFECRKCDVKFTQKVAVRIHMRSVHESKKHLNAIFVVRYLHKPVV